MNVARVPLIGYAAACLAVFFVLPAAGIGFLLSLPRLSGPNVFISSEAQRLGVFQARWDEKAGRRGIVVWQGMRTVFYPLSGVEAPDGTGRMSVLLPDCSSVAVLVLRNRSGGDTGLGVFERGPLSHQLPGRVFASGAEPGIALNRSGNPVFAQAAPDGKATCR